MGASARATGGEVVEVSDIGGKRGGATSVRGSYGRLGLYRAELMMVECLEDDRRQHSQHLHVLRNAEILEAE